MSASAIAKGTLSRSGFRQPHTIYPRVSPDGKQISLSTENGQGGRRLGLPPRRPEWAAAQTHVWRQEPVSRVVLRQPTDRVPVRSRGRSGRSPAASDEPRARAVDEARIRDRPCSGFVVQRDAHYLAVTVVRGSSYSLAMCSARQRKTSEFASATSSALPTAVFSRDGRWLAYSSSDSGRWARRCTLQPFPPTGGGYQVFAQPADNPHHPLSSPDGRVLSISRASRLRSGGGHYLPPSASATPRRFRGVRDSADLDP